MDLSVISIVVSGFVATIAGLNFINTLVIKKESNQDKLAKAVDVSDKLLIINKDIKTIENKLEDHGAKISQLQIQAAVSEAQMSQQLGAVEKMASKFDHWRDDE